MTVDVEKARALAKYLRGCDVTEGADMIDALLDERTNLMNKLKASGRHKLREEVSALKAERDALARELEQLRLAVDRMTR